MNDPRLKGVVTIFVTVLISWKDKVFSTNDLTLLQLLIGVHNLGLTERPLEMSSQ